MKPDTLHRICRFFIVLIASIFLFFFGGRASAQIARVDVDSSGNGPGTTWANAFDNLQDALDFASNEENEIDEIWIAEGTYTPTSGACNPECETEVAFELVPGVDLYGGFDATESVLDDRDFLNNITILSGDRLGNDGANFTNRSDNSEQVIRAVDLGALTIVDGFTIRGGNGGPGGGAYIEGSNLTTLGPAFRNCKFIDNRATIGGAVRADTITLNMRDCTIKQNKAGVGGGIRAERAILRHCTIQDNVADDPAVAQLHITGECALVDCTIGESARAGGRRPESTSRRYPARATIHLPPMRW